MKPSPTWALVMDSVRTRNLCGVEDPNGEEPFEPLSGATSTHIHDIMADNAARSFASGASGRRWAMQLGSAPVRRESFAIACSATFGP